MGRLCDRALRLTSNRWVCRGIGVASLIYAPFLALTVSVATPRFLGLTFPQLYFWLCPLALALFGLALLVRVNFIRAAAWVVVLVLGAWLLEIAALTAHHLFSAYLVQSGMLFLALWQSAAQTAVGLIEAIEVWLPMALALIFALFSRPNHGAPSNIAVNADRPQAELAGTLRATRSGGRLL